MKEDIKAWARAALVRAVRTAAQSALAVLTGCSIVGEADWPLAASAALFGGIYSVLTSLAGIPEAAEGRSVAAVVAKRNETT